MVNEDRLGNHSNTTKNKQSLSCPWCVEDSANWICNYGRIDQYRCKICNYTFTIKDGGKEELRVTFNN